MKQLRILILVTGLALLVAACGTATGSGDGSDGVVEEIDFLDGLGADDIVIQLDHEPGFTTPEYFQPFGRIPHFTLYGDGRVIYREASVANEEYTERIVEAQMESGELRDFYGEIVALGALTLESWTDMCAPAGGEFEECIADAGNDRDPCARSDLHARNQALCWFR